MNRFTEMAANSPEAGALMLRGMVSILEQEQQDRIKEALARIEAVMEEFGDDGLVAVTIVCAEAAAKINAR